MNLKLFLILTFGWILAMIVSLYVGTFAHEMVHQNIYTYYGMNSTIDVSLLERSHTYANWNYNTSEYDTNAIHWLNIEDDIVSYNLTTTNMILYFILYCLLLIVGELIVEKSNA